MLISQFRLPGVPGSSVSSGGPPWPKTDDTYAVSNENNTNLPDVRPIQNRTLLVSKRLFLSTLCYGLRGLRRFLQELPGPYGPPRFHRSWRHLIQAASRGAAKDSMVGAGTEWFPFTQQPVEKTPLSAGPVWRGIQEIRAPGISPPISSCNRGAVGRSRQTAARSIARRFDMAIANGRESIRR